jgi:mRNA interferase MazF
MTNPEPLHGEIWWVRIPNQPNDPHQPRTAVIVSPDGRNKYANDVIVVPTTSSLQKPHPEMHIHIPAGEGGLPKDSYAKCDQVTTIDKSLLDTAAGPLGARIHRKYRWNILEGVRIALGDTRV